MALLAISWKQLDFSRYRLLKGKSLNLKDVTQWPWLIVWVALKMSRNRTLLNLIIPKSIVYHSVNNLVNIRSNILTIIPRHSIDRRLIGPLKLQMFFLQIANTANFFFKFCVKKNVENIYLSHPDQTHQTPHKFCKPNFPRYGPYSFFSIKVC